jgi:hypothetical protein
LKSLSGNLGNFRPQQVSCSCSTPSFIRPTFKIAMVALSFQALCTRKRLRVRSAKRTPNTVGARILRKKTLRCKNTLKMRRLCFVIKVSNALGLGAMNSLGAQTARRVKRLAARIVGCIIRLFAEDAADVNGRLHRCQVESERTVAQSPSPVYAVEPFVALAGDRNHWLAYVSGARSGTRVNARNAVYRRLGTRSALAPPLDFLISCSFVVLAQHQLNRRWRIWRAVHGDMTAPCQCRRYITQ